MRHPFLFAFISFAVFSSALSEMSVPAVDSNNNGLITRIEASVKPGSGNVYVDVEPFISVETQFSAKTAAKVAARKAGKNFSQLDFFFKILAKTESVDGPSGGIAMTLLSYAELTGRTLRSDMTATGTVELGGSVGPVGGIPSKLEAAADQGITLALIPLGERIQNGIDLAQLAESKWNLQVVEIKNLDEALAFAFGKPNTRVVVPERKEPPLVLDNLTVRLSRKVEPFRSLVALQNGVLGGLYNRFGNDSIVAGVIRKSVNTSGLLFQNGYYYSSANEAFITQVQTEAFSLSNTSMDTFRTKVENLDRELAAFDPVSINRNNLEWAVGSRLRWYWARARLADVQDKMKLSERTLPLLQDYASSLLWLSAAKQLDQIASEIKGETLDPYRFESYALDRLELANESFSENPVDPEADFHLDTARLSLENNDFLTASFDASFVLAFTPARGKLAEQADQGTLLPPVASTLALGRKTSAWGQLYYVHALYNLQEANRSGDFGYVINAMKLIELAKELDDNVAVLSGNPPEKSTVVSPRSSSGPNREVPLPSYPDPLLFSAVLVLVVGLLAALVLVILKKPRQDRSYLSKKDRLDLLEQRLLEGSVSEKTYLKISRKYEGKRSK